MNHRTNALGQWIRFQVEELFTDAGLCLFKLLSFVLVMCVVFMLLGGE